jgi:hypothetical protein
MKSEYIKPVAEVVKFQPAEEITSDPKDLNAYLSAGSSHGVWWDEEE